MVGIVIVSHSFKLAEGIKDFVRVMAKNCPIASCGGNADGSYGTSFELINDAIESVISDDGVVVLVDMGSAVMTTEMVIEEKDNPKIKLADCPIAEGAMAAAMDSELGMSIEDILIDLEQVRNERKLDY